MGALTFDKKELGNLEYSLTREMLATDRRGGYMSTTIVCCNTRKYHGLVVSPIDDSGRDFVLLSSLDETIIRDGQRFNLALHRFRDVYEPRGHKYITDFEYTPTPTITYRVGDVVLKKELLWIHRRTQLMVRYTFVEGDAEQISLQLRPFLAFRDRHALSKANMEANGLSYPVKGGVKCKLYEGFPWLYMQSSRDNTEFVPAPDWYYDFEYQREIERGYDAHEDLLTPGYFETVIKKGESIIMSVSTDEMASSKQIEEDYETSVARRTHKVDFLSCLRHSARQFLIKRANGDTEVLAGYPWYGMIGREAMIALPGLTLEQGHKEDCMAVMDTVINKKSVHDRPISLQPCHAVDAPLWAVRALQMLEDEVGAEMIWERYGDEIKNLLNFYKSSCNNVSLHDNGLIWAWSNERSITWMDTTEDSRKLSSRRNGYQVEVNALWYNAVCYVLDLAKQFGDKQFVEEWEWLPERAKATFQSLFWLNEGWLADFVNHDEKKCSVRPNMIIACALRYKMLTEQQQVSVIRTVQQHLLTPKGLRSLSPINPLYGFGRETSNNIAPKNGSVWAWSLSFYVRACFDILGESFVPDAEKILSNFHENIQIACIGSISEYFEPDPPHHARGSISQAWSVASLLEISQMIEKYKSKKPARKPRATKATAAKTTATKTTATKTTAAKAKSTTTRKKTTK